MAKIIRLIQTEKKTGLGVEHDPIRSVYQLWTLDGKLLVERDSHTNKTFFDDKNLPN